MVSGEIPACKWVILACQRHLDDLETGAHRGLTFDVEAEARVIKFFAFLKHSKGEWAGQSFELDLWQQFILGSVFGWKKSDGTRRFRTAYNEVPRKNGKSTLAGGVSLFALTADGEPGAEIYAAATKKDQARIVFNEAKNMVLASEALRSRVRVYKSNMNVQATLSKFEPLGSDSETLDGLNVHVAVNDELHAWRDRDLYDVIETATGSRRQPLLFNITTAGKNPNGICWETREYAEAVLQGLVHDDSFFAYIAGIDKSDAWDDPLSWRKANPGYGISVKPDDLERLAVKARHMPRARAAFMRLRLNVWTFGIDTWLPLERWRLGAAPIDEKALEGRTCYAGLDLSSTTDISALALVFPPPDFDPAAAERLIRAADPEDEDGDTEDLRPELIEALKGWTVLWRFYMPAANVQVRTEEDRVPYQQWVDDGLITATPGNVVDYDFIRRDANQVGERFRIAEFAIDRWNSTHMATLLAKDGFVVVPFGQGYGSMSGPSKFLEGLVYGGLLQHGGNAVADWMSQNVVVTEDEARNIKPVKKKSTGRIDGIIALIMALGRAIVAAPPEEDVDVSSIFGGVA